MCIMENSPEQEIVYETPFVFMVLFYTLLAIWTVVSIVFISVKISTLSSLLVLMILLFIAYTWYFSLGLFYKISLRKEGSIRMKSFRRAIHSHSQNIQQVEGAPLPLPFGFMTFRIGGERVFLFFTKSLPFRKILSALLQLKPEIEFKKMSPGMFV